MMPGRTCQERRILWQVGQIDCTVILAEWAEGAFLGQTRIIVMANHRTSTTPHLRPYSR
jgi:hypothetical protein